MANGRTAKRLEAARKAVKRSKAGGGPKKSPPHLMKRGQVPLNILNLTTKNRNIANCYLGFWPTKFLEIESADAKRGRRSNLNGTLRGLAYYAISHW
jgi:hypothetical protein